MKGQLWTLPRLKWQRPVAAYSMQHASCTGQRASVQQIANLQKLAEKVVNWNLTSTKSV